MSMSDDNNPSLNPSNLGGMTGLLNEVLIKFLQGVDDMLPARVISYDRASNRAQVQPLISMLTTSGEVVPRAQVASIPVLNIGGGGYILSFNILPGDLGWIKANDRDISLFMQTMKDEVPNTKRKHSFQDALFIPHVMKDYIIAGEDAQAVVLQSLDGATKISLGPSGIKMTADAIVLESDTLTHNGKNIGDTHIHTGVDPGGGTSGPPA